MKQGDLGLNLTTKRTRKREFLDEMNLVVPWTELVAIRSVLDDLARGRPFPTCGMSGAGKHGEQPVIERTGLLSASVHGGD